MKKSEIKKLDLLWAKKVKEHAGNRCEYCHRHGSEVWLNACHVVGRSYRGTRWGAWFDDRYDLCGHSLCYEHHRQYDQHGPQEQDIIDSVIGRERKVRLQQTAEKLIGIKHEYSEVKDWIEKVRKK